MKAGSLELCGLWPEQLCWSTCHQVLRVLLDAAREVEAQRALQVKTRVSFDGLEAVERVRETRRCGH